MANLNEYLSPTSIADAVRLLTSAEGNYVPLAGGTRLVGEIEMGQVGDLDGVVDLAGLGLDTIEVDGDVLAIGAMTTLTDLVAHEVAGELSGGLLKRAARGEGPINLRNAATIGGIIATAEPDSEFYAALLALEATVTIHDETGFYSTPLAELADIHGLIESVTLPMSNARSGLARVARTPSDRPIVAAVAVVTDAGDRVALCGVSERPILRGAEFSCVSDFKASAEYRRAMAEVVLERALSQVV